MTTTEAIYDRQTDLEIIRYLLRTNFYAFCKHMDSQFYADDRPHLQLLCYYLQRISEGIITKLMLSLPPRAGKSYTVSLWCAWMLGKHYNNPHASIMRNSYGQTLAEKFSYDIRGFIKSDKFLFVFPGVALKSDHFRVGDWAVATSAQSAYFCSGVGGSVIGKGCTLAAILDDPIKNLEDALSELILDKTWLWYVSAHKSRLETGCPEIQIATRWSRRDPIGMLLEHQVGLWTIVIIPALDEDGKSFCEAVKTTEEYEEIKAILDDYVWEAEFMQSPVEAKGLLFPKEDLQYYNGSKLNLEEVESIFGFTDTADEGQDYLVSITAILRGEEVFIHDVICTQDPIEITQPLIAGQLINNNHNSHLIESNSGGKGFAMKVRELLKYKSRCRITWKHTYSNKETRMLMNSGQIKEFFRFRNDYKVGSDYDKFMRMLTSYVKLGKNKHDDAPDALTGVAEQVFMPRGIRLLSNKTTE